MSTTRIPTYFVSHGSPMMALPNDNEKLTQDFLRDLGKDLLGSGKIKGVVICSAHWEEDQNGLQAPRVAVTTARHPELIYDFYGFPHKLYEVEYHAQGSEELGKRVQEALTEQNINCDLDNKRGLDHGAWVAAKLMFPDSGPTNETTVPIVQLSLSSSLDPDFHVAVGKAIKPLRDEGILILGSGGAVHNLRQLFGPKASWSTGFIEALTEVFTAHGEDRRKGVAALTKLPVFRMAHPRAEHFMPVAVVIGAADDLEDGTVVHENYPDFAPNLALHAFKVGT
ncbi:hypothetical protein SmJEL517_g03695 [Synchytrium microbalum]|uniref:Extradiol ring-cleavage dioxygenase class III enzyme subunit B domain-containing protein n=1 Tax=Synchytrium microbalum TaxID=1806994 RepID=A0A507C0W2_9FUNG|nr:uncharacterized protein SmJEL517_g03695 [Synchytrium microbalum]TPX33332.1 hypothetical protein SmJEL517_g03695 [Synchytrium microbalum]